MGIQTDIQWCDSTLNIQMGCQGCELWNPAAGVFKCYAGVLTERMTTAGPIKGWPEAFRFPKIFPHRMAEAERWSDLTGCERPHKPWLNGLPRLVFTNDMGDTWTDGLDRDWLAPYLPRMVATSHIYQILTKRPLAAAGFFTKH